MKLSKITMFLVVLALASVVQAAPTQYGVNGHYYEAIQTGSLDYNQAKAAAATQTYMGRAGHLPTFADLPYGVAQGENEWVKANVFIPAKTGGFWGYWFGLESPGANTDFRWSTGEYYRDGGTASHYNDWGYMAGSTNHGVFYHSDHDQWQNGPKSYTHTGLGYLVEYDIPTYNAANGHYYEVVEAGEAGFVDEDGVGMSYNDAKADAASRSWMGATGHLISVNDAAEQAFMAGLIGPFDGLPKPAFYFIGLEHAAGTTDFEWASGESYNDGVDYDNWDGANPDAGATDVGTFMAVVGGTDWQWNDIDSTYTDSPYPLSNRFRGYVVEYVPEPATLAVLCLGAVAFLARRRR